jgi:cyclopropane fatty-acyl-phospholipid synthase-like methyltransferase
MINSFHKHPAYAKSNQSGYSNDFDRYRNGILPHRWYAADYWEETIPLIQQFLEKMGLKPEHKLLDLGAGSLRSGLAVVPYLISNNYYAVDINRYLLEDGYKYEIIANNLDDKLPLNNIKITDDFNAEDFDVKFDYVWSFSLWTHLDLNNCDKCLKELSKVLKPGSIYLTTCFVVSDNEYSKIGIRKSDVNLRTFHNRNPYHHRLDDFVKIGDKHGFKTQYMGIGSCCPRKHDVVKFTKVSN